MQGFVTCLLAGFNQALSQADLITNGLQPTLSVVGRVQVNDMPVESYILPSPRSLAQSWKWDKGRWGNDGKVGEVVEALNKVNENIPSILASIHSRKLNLPPLATTRK